MKTTFWQELPKPFFALAPMEDVTDIAFREMFARHSKPGSPLVLWTEFVPSDGLAFGDAHAQEKLRAKLSYTPAQRPIIAQVYNADPGRMREAAALVQELGFDGVDINMGCPVNAVIKQVSGAALIQHPNLACQLIEAVKEGAPKLPVSVKTRIGYNRDEIDTWIRTLLEQQLDALTVHLRTRKEMSKVPAHWERMSQVVALRNQIAPETVLIGNGDVADVAHGQALVEQYQCEGIMIGRGAFGTPDLFANHKTDRTHKIKMLIEHLEVFDELLLQRQHKACHVMKKHFKAYISGWNGAKEQREMLMATESPQEAIRILQESLV